MVAVVAVLVAGLAGCSASDDPQTTGCDRIDKVKFQSNWDGTPPQDHYFWVAKERGYFADACLDVELEFGKGSSGVAQMVSAGRADFGTMSAVALVQATAKDPALRLISVAVTLPKDLNAWIYRADGNIQKPKDFEGKTLGTTAENFMVPLLPALGAAAGFDASTVKIVTTDIGGRISLFANGRLDITSLGYGEVPNVTLTESVGELGRLVLSDYLPMIGYSLVARSDYVNKNPEVTKRFVGAVQRALTDFVKDPESTLRTAAEVMQEKVTSPPSVDLILKAGTPAMKDLMVYEDGVAVGHVSPEAWEEMIAVLSKYANLTNAPNVADLATNEFLS
ncbi:ABC transporter substrate-binding protein [Rhizomonospora bruguierae]|uniref:ABC transporter substrate-binding protein n=1 Tax=Rhizomonospora bruguierae TaxID=1581705 RepID=UPI001BCD34D9|nr:ABC transporter substrate-binding protein [Micromonospora sp. NBRC 107566]